MRFNDFFLKEKELLEDLLIPIIFKADRLDGRFRDWFANKLDAKHLHEIVREYLIKNKLKAISIYYNDETEECKFVEEKYIR